MRKAFSAATLPGETNDQRYHIYICRNQNSIPEIPPSSQTIFHYSGEELLHRSYLKRSTRSIIALLSIFNPILFIFWTDAGK
ncbi:hypothetical protein CEXT_487441 [Caerostris extrusa]|uniref:Uncharacterized protein n=1 Tax=Caerostris extrusa TaxID=172846 RepID=A0AAV4XZ95_CAEEX|nr:hypothetical protein CEXT_487441 [Caerostris extrusa]